MRGRLLPVSLLNNPISAAWRYLLSAASDCAAHLLMIATGFCEGDMPAEEEELTGLTGEKGVDAK
jgi:hypothetical protein